MNSFKKTLRTVLIFFLVIVVLSICIMEPYFASANYYYQDANERRGLAGTLDFIVLGSSHSLRGIRPDILDEKLGVNSYNLSIAHPSMLGRYTLLKKELERNPVNTVILELSYSSLTMSREDEGYEGDYYTLSKLDTIPERTIYYFSSLYPSEYAAVYSENMLKGFKSIKKLINGTWRALDPNVYKGYAWYSSDPETISTDYTDRYHTGSLSATPYEDNVEELEKILNLCDERGVRVILVSLPISEQMTSYYDDLDIFREWYEDIAEQYGTVYYDFTLYKDKIHLLPDSVAFQNVNHLSNEGAAIFTGLFADVYEQIRSGEDVSNLFFDNYEELDIASGYVP